jgi:1-phosphofructokinase family hexose kinase
LILTLTLNPAIDHNVSADRLVFDDRAYILEMNDMPGGRGIHASMVIHAFGGKTEAIATAGGQNGERLKMFLADRGFGAHLVPIANQIRTNLTITDKHGLTVKLNEFGPELSAQEVAEVEKTVQRHLGKAKWLMLCGSLPPGAPPDFYARLVEIARTRKVKTLVDADGEALLHAIEARPTVATPNQQEAERLLSRALLARSHYIEATERIQAMGVEQVVLSLGSRGAMGMVDGNIFEAVPPRLDAVCPIGAGDALAAAFVWALSRGKTFPDALRWGVAAGSASAMLPGVTFANLDQTRGMYKRVDARSVG